MTDPMQDIEEYLRATFEENYELLRVESGAALAPAAKDAALQQVLYYWRKLHQVAEHVTETEVKLTLPNQATPAGRSFTIEGIVDIVREDNRTVMYDIKTHTADDVRANLSEYEQQLNVYAHIWHQLRGHALDEAAIIATRFPASLQNALNRGSLEQVEVEVAKWEPLVPIPYDSRHVEATIHEFGVAVDGIEDGIFDPPPPSVLSDPLKNSRQRFGSLVCVECDARYSCASYRAYAAGASPRHDRLFNELYPISLLQTPEQESWQTATLAAQDGVE